MDSYAKLNFLQINLGRASHATIELRSAIAKFSPNIIAIQEPYNLKGSPVDFPRSYTLAANAPNPKACILTSPDTTCVMITELSDSLICVCEIQTAGSPPLIVVNCYLPPSLQIASQLERIQTIVCLLSGRDILVLGDFNAQSTLWHSRKTNYRGRAVETMLCETGLSLHNAPQALSTFDAAVGQSNIDLTLSLLSHFTVSNWAVTDDVCCSDHNLISFSAEILSPRETVMLPTRVYFNKSNWKEIARLIKKVDTNPCSPADVVRTIDTMKSIAYDNRTVRPSRNVQGFTWTKELVSLRSQVRFLRTKFSKTHDERTLELFRKKRNLYQTALRKAKFEAWLNVTSRDNSPWGLSYKSAFNRLPKKRAMQADLNPESLGPCAKESLTELAAGEVLTSLFPPDTCTNDSPDHSALRDQFSSARPDELPEPTKYINLTCAEVSAAIDGINPKKAPGSDEIPHIFWKFTHLVTLRKKFC